MSEHFAVVLKNKTNFDLKIKIGMINLNKKVNQNLITKTLSRNNTTLGYEALSKNIRGVCFPEIFPYKNYSKSFKKEGPFWSTNINKKKLDKKIDSVMQLTNKKWKKYIKEIAEDIIIYNPNNKLFKQKLKKIL